MKLQSLFVVSAFVAALPAFAVTCNSPQVAVGNNCTLSVALGWVIAGLGTDSILTVYVPPNASGPVDIEVTALSSSLGNTYKGYFGFVGSKPGQSGTQIFTLADIIAGAPNSVGTVSPGQGFQFRISQICWDPTCTAQAPAGAVPNMLSLEFVLSSPNTLDINTNDVQLSARFLNGQQVTFQTQETVLHTNSIVSIVPGINLGATAATRYVTNGVAAVYPYDVISISNLDNPGSISGTATLKDFAGNVMASVPVPSIPPSGSAGFLVIGRTPGDTLGLFPSSTNLPAGSDNIFHGILEVALNGLVLNGVNIVLAQEFNGNSMLNQPVFHSPVQ